jgi:hypothetical protein
VKQIRIFGCSDDTIYVLDDIGNHQLTAGKRPIRDAAGTEIANYAGTLTLFAQHSELTIHCLYDGSWSFAASQGDAEEIDAFRFKIHHHWAKHEPYSATVVVKAPDDTTLMWEGAD